MHPSSQPEGVSRRFILAAAAASLASGRALADGEVVRIVVPFGPGAVADTLARALSEPYARQLGQPVIVENRPGAGGTVGTAYVAKAPPDGRTLLFAAGSHTLAAQLYPNLPYHPIRDFVPIAHVGNFGFVIAVSGSLGVTDLAGFLQEARAHPGALNFASSGIGSAGHLGMAWFLERAGVRLEHIPFKSTGDAVKEVIAGRAQAVMAPVTGLVGFRNDTRIKLVAYTGAASSPTLPELPTITGSVLPGFVFEAWNAVLGPAGIPAAEAQRLSSALYQVLAQPAVHERLAQLGVETDPLPPTAFATLLRQDWENAGAIVRASGAKPE
jgi:tripartite-type tricarboxylate transporter receptor subunit TctC